MAVYRLFIHKIYPAIPITIAYSVGDQSYVVDSYFGASVSTLEVPSREGYTFVEFTDESGKAYASDDVWDNEVGMTLQTKWNANEYRITFSGYGTQDLTEKTVVYDTAVGELPVPTTAGPVFMGWKDAEGKSYNAMTTWKTAGDVVLYADFNGTEEGNAVLYVVTFDQNGGTGELETVTAEFSAEMPEGSAPTREGYVFKGYYTEKSGGVKYYNADMTSARAWDLPADTTLYAHWEEVKSDNTLTVILIVVGAVAVLAVAGIFVAKSLAKKRKN